MLDNGSARKLSSILAGTAGIAAPHEVSKVTRKTVWVAMRDGVRLATDLYFPSDSSAPAIAIRTPYGRGLRADTFLGLAHRGYIVVSQDCRGTGESGPDYWDFMVYEPEDSFDLVEWVCRQDWFAGFLGSIGGSYDGWMQWCMSRHPAMSAIAPEVAGFGVSNPSTRPSIHMFANAYSRSVGKGAGKVDVGLDQLEHQMLTETLASGYFNEPLYAPFPEALIARLPEVRTLPPGEGRRRLYEEYRTLPPAGRAELVKLALGEDEVTYAGMVKFGATYCRHAGDGYVLPRASDSDLFQSLHAPALLVSGWYDWNLDYTLKTWDVLTREAREPVSSRSRLLISPGAHNAPGYREGREGHPELDRIYRTDEILEVLLQWCAAVRHGVVHMWPTIVYYLMGANEWRTASAWPLPESVTCRLYLDEGGQLSMQAPGRISEPDRYIYDPEDPTSTVGGSILSFVYPPGSVDVREVQTRSDVLIYTSAVLERDLDVVGPLRLILYASSSAADTDFSARLSDVFPDGRAIQLQNGTLRARYRSADGNSELLEPGRVYRFEIDMWATANRFKAGHRIRLDVSSADFPRFDRNTNRGGEPGPPISATQLIFHDADQASHLVVAVVGDALDGSFFAARSLGVSGSEPSGRASHD